MDSNSNPVLKLPTFVNTRGELESIVSERQKMEAELRELEAHMHSFEDSILKRGGPYFGRIAQGERAEQIIEGINKSSKVKSENGSTESSSESDKERKVKEPERLFSNSSVTSPASVNQKSTSEVKTMSQSIYSKRP